MEEKPWLAKGDDGTDPLTETLASAQPAHIVTNPLLRHVSIERRLQEFYREQMFYQMLIVGAVLLLVAIIW